MKPIALLVALAVLGLWIGRVTATRGVQAPSFAPPTHLPASALEILAAQPFVVDEPFVHEWRAEKPLVSSGYLLALRVDPDLARTRQTHEPVLYVGDQTAERCNAPIEGDVLIVLVPSPLAADGRVALDLETVPIWFGSLELPERVDAARITRELASARAQGIGATRKNPQVARRLAADDAIRAHSRWELQPYVDDLSARYSPR